MTRAAGTPVFSDDSGVRMVTLQVAARALVGLFVLVTVALAVSLVLGVPLPGLDRLVPGRGPGQQHQATRDAPLTHDTTGKAAGSGAVGADSLAGLRAPGRTESPSTTRSRSQRSTSTRKQDSGSSAAPIVAVAEPASRSSSAAPAGAPSSSPSDHPGNVRPSAKPRNPKAATPTRGSSAFSSSRAHRATASADPTQSTPGRSGASHGKSGTAGSG